MTLNDALSKGAIALACTSLAWLGGSVVGSARDNTRQDERIEQLERRQQSLDETLKQLDARRDADMDEPELIRGLHGRP